MSNKTRKYAWPVSAVMAFALVAALAAFIVLAASPNGASAHPPDATGTHNCPTDVIGQNVHNNLDPTGTQCSSQPTPAPTATPDPTAEDDIAFSSSSASGSLKITLDIANLSMDLKDGSSVVLYLEDDFKVPDSISTSDVYFIATDANTANRNNGGRVFPTYGVEIDDDDHFGDDDSWDIQVFVPDFDTRDVDAAEGFQAPMMNEKLQLVITKAAGIKNPSEAHDSKNDYAAGYKVAYAVIGPGKSVPTASETNLDDHIVKAKIGLSDDAGGRGDELTVTGTGFNNGTSAAVHVLSGISEKPTCGTVLTTGTRAGIATVGSDDKVAVSFEVTVPTFMPGEVNWVCMVDGEGRMSIDDVEGFELEPSIRVVPSSANAGDTVTVFAQDFPADTGGFTELKIANRTIEVDSSSGINNDGSGTATFDLPGSVGGSALEGTVRIDAKWGSTNENTKITVVGSQLSLSKGEALANELITITGDGFGGDHIDAMDITIDGVPLMVDEASKDGDMVEISNAGQFVASVVLWPEGRGTNPTLIAGTHTIKVKDNMGFSGSAVITIPAATLSVTPEVAGPRDVITIRGENWPIDNIDGAAPDAVDITVSDGSRTRRYSAFADSAGRFTVEHRVASDVAIPSTNQVRAEVESGDIVELGSFEVPASVINVEPGTAQPGDTISLSVDGMPVYQQVDRVEIGGRNVMPVGNFSTDRNGSVSVDGVLVPGLDPGTYSVLLDVENTIAIGSLDILSEGPIGTDTAVADAVAPLGDSLAAVFHFNNVNKDWAFYDPRPEFAELNTLASMINGEAYWVLTTGDVEDVVLNNKSRSLSCAGDDCWNLVIW